MAYRLATLLAFLLLVVALSGCATPPERPTQATTAGGAGRDGGSDADTDTDTPRVGEATFTVSEPTPLDVGTVFSYRAEGPWSLQDDFDAVVARSDEKGVFLAGVAADDLTQAILEGSPLFGHFARDLAKVHPSTGQVFHQNLVFPLHNGKEWDLEDWHYVAHEQDVVWPGGADRGFLVEAVRGKQTMRYEWAPDPGFFVSHSYDYEGRGLMWRFTLQDVSSSGTYTWFDYTAWGWTGSTTNATSVEVPASTDTVFFEAYGDDGDFVAVAPDGRHERFEPTDREVAIVRSVPAAPGHWALGGIVPPDVEATLWLVAVSWETGPVPRAA